VLPTQAQLAQAPVDFDQVNHRHTTAGIAPDQVQTVGAELGFPGASEIEHELDQGLLAILLEESEGGGLIGGGS
jgi:hypothetical protein